MKRNRPGIRRLGAMVSLGLNLPSITSTSPLETQPPRKSAGLAFVISLLVPGGGQMYCGKVARGGTTLAFFVLSVVLTVVGFSVPESTGRQVLGVAMLAVMVLYVFSFLDAYYVAREINAGTDLLVESNNPRVASTLNLLTNGFGYWYLGERTKGWAAFIVLGLVMRGISNAVGDSPWSLLLLIIPCMMGLDAYRIARQQVAEARGTLAETPTPPPGPETRLPAAIPIVLACLPPLILVGLVAIGLAAPKFEPVDQSHAVVDSESNPKRYENPTYGVRLLAPTGWDLNPSRKGYLISAKKGAACQVMLIGQAAAPFRSLAADVDIFTTDMLQKNDNFRKVAERPDMLGNLPGKEVEFVATFHGNDVIQRYLFVRRGMALYALVTTIASSLQQDCEQDATRIRESIHFQ